MSVLVVVPARFASTRYPGKPLVALKGASGVSKTLIERSWLAATMVTGVSRVVVATDDHRICRAAEGFGADVVMTSESCANGTERCAEVISSISEDYEIVVNLQGDAPLTPHWFVETLIAELQSNQNADLATPVLQCDGQTLDSLKSDRKADRVGGTTAVFGADRSALYFSKEVIPFSNEVYDPSDPTPVFHHVGVYAYRSKTLLEYPDWPVGPLERLEGLEQLRFLENGRRAVCVEVAARGREFWELNNPEDVEKIETMMRKMDVD